MSNADTNETAELLSEVRKLLADYLPKLQADCDRWIEFFAAGRDVIAKLIHAIEHDEPLDRKLLDSVRPLEAALIEADRAKQN